MRFSLALILGLASLVIIYGIYYVSTSNFSDALETLKLIDVKIRLKNECTVIDTAFIAEAPKLGKSSKFYDKIAVMRVPEKTKVKLSVSRDFPDFVYDGVLQTVEPEMFLVADCSISPRLKSIFGSMKNRFGE